MRIGSARFIAVAAVVGALLPAACSSAGGSTPPDGGAGSSGGVGTTDAAASDGSALTSDAAADSGGGFTDAPHDAPVAADGNAPLDASSGGDGPSTGEGPYGGDGPSTVTTASLQVPAPNGSFTTTAYVPSAAGPLPVVILSSGFFQTAAAYAPYAQRLASWGIVTLLRDDPNLAESTPNVVGDVEYMVTTWLASTGADASSALHGKVDVTKVGLAGHSRGGQIALLAGEGLAGKVRGVFGLDPVDTSMNGDPEARTTLATIAVPVAFIGETTDSASSGCAPGTDNFLVLYQAAASPAVAITAVDADHTMFEDPASCSFCTLCTAGTASAATVLATGVRYLMAFFARELLGDASVGAAFQGAGAAQDVAAGITQIVSK